MEPTIFDRILSHEIPADIVFENEHVLAFRDIQPQAPVHVLVIPKTRFLNLTEATKVDPSVLANFIKGISLTATALGLDPNGYRVVFNNGLQAQQSVPYVHAHLLGGHDLHWPPG